MVEPRADGAETFNTIRGPTAPEDYSWNVQVGDGQAIVPSADGEVAVVQTTAPDDTPAPAPMTPADPAEIPTLVGEGHIDYDTFAPT